PQPIATGSHERDDSLAGKIVRLQETANGRRCRLAPNWKAQVQSVVLGDARNLRGQCGFITAVALLARLLDGLQIVFGISSGGPNLKQIGTKCAMYQASNDSCIS